MQANDNRPLPQLLALLLPALAGCSSEPAGDPDSRSIPWKYGPTNSLATSEHMRATGSEGPGPIAKGWRCKLNKDGVLSVQPYQLANSHALFGKVALTIGLFDQSGNQLETLQSATLTAASATFQFELSADVASQLWDVVLWFRRP